MNFIQMAANAISWLFKFMKANVTSRTENWHFCWEPFYNMRWRCISLSVATPTFGLPIKLSGHSDGSRWPVESALCGLQVLHTVNSEDRILGRTLSNPSRASKMCFATSTLGISLTGAAWTENACSRLVKICTELPLDWMTSLGVELDRPARGLRERTGVWGVMLSRKQ